jgi:predicted nucleic-acid-binding protein
MEDIRIIGLDTNIFLNVLKEESGMESSAMLLEHIEAGKVLGVTKYTCFGARWGLKEKDW